MLFKRVKKAIKKQKTKTLFIIKQLKKTISKDIFAIIQVILLNIVIKTYF